MKAFHQHHICGDAFACLRQRLTRIIIDTAAPDAIYLLGTQWHQRRTESIFNTTASAATQIPGSCLLLVLCPTLHGAAPHEWQDKIETHCSVALPVTTLVMETTVFLEWLREAHRFALQVQSSAGCWYSRIDIPETNIPTPQPDQSCLRTGIARAREFLAGAELYCIRKQYPLAVFMLHQCTEQALHAIIRFGTGYCFHTHNIERLLRWAGFVVPAVQEIFPQHTDVDKRLFHLLQKAYVGGRYEAEFRIGFVEVRELRERVRRLVEILD